MKEKMSNQDVEKRLKGLKAVAKKMLLTAVDNIENEVGKENLEKCGWSETDVNFMIGMVLNPMYRAMGVPNDKYEESINRLANFLKEISYIYEDLPNFDTFGNVNFEGDNENNAHLC